jgi:hypothetical protein
MYKTNFNPFDVIYVIVANDTALVHKRVHKIERSVTELNDVGKAARKGM